MREPLQVGREEKIIFRITGSGPLNLYAEQDGIRVFPLTYGEHVRSDWRRPGDEWGSTFVLPKSGCWSFRLERRDASGNVWVVVPPLD